MEPWTKRVLPGGGAQLRRWLLLLSRFSFYETLSKGLMLVTGILVIRSLEKTEYAFYTITHSMLGALGLLSTLGVGTAVISLGGKWIDDREAMGSLLKTAYQYRWVFSAVVGPPVALLMIYLLWKTGCPPLYIAVLFLLSGAIFAIQVHEQLAESVLRLAEQYLFLQKLQLWSNLGRFALVLALSAFYLRAWLLLVFALGIQGFVFLAYIRKRVIPYLDLDAVRSEKAAGQIRSISLNTIPGTLSAVFQAQLAVILITIFGQVDSVAELGALSRIGILFAIPQAINGGIFLPWLARSPVGFPLYRKYGAVVLLSFGIAAVFLGAVYILRFPILGLLGDGYVHLERELIYLAAIQAGAFFVGACAVIVNARAWLRHAWIGPFFVIATQAGSLPFLDLSTVMGVLTLQLVRLAPNVVMTAFLVIRGFQGRGGLDNTPA